MAAACKRLSNFDLAQTVARRHSVPLPYFQRHKYCYMEKNTPANRSAIVIIGLLFFVFGFVTWLNGTLIPFLKIACQLENDIQAFFVTFAFYMAYFFLAIPSSYLLKKTGFKNGMSWGLAVMAVGSLVFIPAAQARSFSLFLTGLFIQGAGLALLQTASNPYISIVGPIESAAKRISIMGICNKVAGILSPLILGTLVLKNTARLTEQLAGTTDATTKNALLNEMAGRVIVPYVVMAVILLLLTLMIRKSSLPEIEMEGEEDSSTISAPQKKTVFQYPHLMLGVLCLFLYVGAEVMAGDAIGTYGRELGMPLSETRYFTSFTLLAMLVGYVIGIFTIPKYISQQKALSISAVIGVVFATGAFVSQGYVAITFIALLGLSNALMWPAIFPLAIHGLGRFTKIGSALLVMGIAGGALMPLLYTGLKDKAGISNHTAFFICMLPSYLYIFFYAVKGYKVGQKKTKKRQLKATLV